MTYMIEAASSHQWRATAKRRASYRTTRGKYLTKKCVPRLEMLLGLRRPAQCTAKPTGMSWEGSASPHAAACSICIIAVGSVTRQMTSIMKIVEALEDRTAT